MTSVLRGFLGLVVGVGAAATIMVAAPMVAPIRAGSVQGGSGRGAAPLDGRVLLTLLMKRSVARTVAANRRAPTNPGEQATPTLGGSANLARTTATPLEALFAATGRTGDAVLEPEYLRLTHEPVVVDGALTVALRVQYDVGPRRVAGLCWQHPDDNWGTKPGRSLLGVQSLEFWARGEAGGEVVEFRSGGTRGTRFCDSFEQSLGKVLLTKDWTHFAIDLSREDLSNVSCGFACALHATGDQDQVVIYIVNAVMR